MYHYTVRDALDLSVAVTASSRIEDNPNVKGLAQVSQSVTIHDGVHNIWHI